MATTSVKFMPAFFRSHIMNAFLCRFLRRVAEWVVKQFFPGIVFKVLLFCLASSLTDFLSHPTACSRIWRKSLWKSSTVTRTLVIETRFKIGQRGVCNVEICWLVIRGENNSTCFVCIFMRGARKMCDAQYAQEVARLRFQKLEKCIRFLL